MKKNRIVGSLIIAMISYSYVGASENSLSLKSISGFEIGLQTYMYEYEEEVDSAFFMSNKGNKYGFLVAATKNIGDNYYFKGDIRYATGDVEYKSASGTGDVSDEICEMRLVTGKEVFVDDYLLGSYIGVGYRMLNNDLRDLGTGGYRRESQYLYIPIGVTHRFHVGSASRISTNIEYDYFVWGEQKSYLSDVNAWYESVFGDTVNKQKNGYGIRVNTAYEEKKWSIGIFLNYWNIKDSEINYYLDGYDLYYGMEPSNDTKELGIEMKYRF